MLRRLYNWMIELSSSKHAVPVLSGVSFAESSFFPFPPDIMLLPMCMARPDRAYWYAFACTVSSVLGGLVGYMIGALLYDTVGAWVIKAYGYGDKVETFRAAYAQYGHWIILLKGFTPIPYKVVTITSGFANYDLVMFTLLSLLTRGARFYLLAGVMHRFGAPIRRMVEENLVLATVLFLVVLVGGFALIKVFV
jgi:membrane protein YqaA with SNARE-associated domain